MAARSMNALAVSVMVTAALGLSQRWENELQTIHVSVDQEGAPVSFDTHWKAQAASMPGTTRVLDNGVQCLNFLHIPKSGGTTIEDKNATGLKDGPDWGKYDETLRCTGMHPCPKDLPWRGHERCCPMEDGNICSVWHVPPHLDTRLEQHYAQCETFCVVRDPAARFRSQHVWNLRKETNLNPPACSTPSVSNAVHDKLLELKKQPYVNDCHYIPQVEYWRDGQSCQHFIKQENLEADFSRLAAKFGMKVHFHYVKNPQSGLHCDAPFNQRSLEELQEHYAADYEAFGYARSGAV